jgi:pimeloyl-ACP methyl ester carboxylesterase
MSTFVLVHGASHGAWCWYKVISRLKSAGHRVLAPDLPGHGRDRTPLEAVTLAAYVDRVCEAIDAAPEPVVLVGHSMGGGVISQAAEQRSDRVSKLVFLTAMMFEDGEAMFGAFQQDTESLLLANMQVSDDQSYMTFPDEVLKEVFYAESPAADAELARLLLVPQALAPGATPIRLSEDGYGQVPRIYIECLRDRAITHGYQRATYERVGCERVITLDTDHSPFFSMPDELANELGALA